jgi:signal transduction histidine kinase
MSAHHQAEEKALAPAGLTWWWIAGPPTVVLLVATFMVAYSDGTDLQSPTLAQQILVGLGSAALLFRYHHPVAVQVVTVLCGSALPMVEPHRIMVDGASMLALYTLTTLVDRRTAWTAAAAAVVFLTLGAAPWQPNGLFDLHSAVPANYIAIAVAVGDSVRTGRILLQQSQERAQQAELTRDQEGQRRVREERIRIARDLHDVVAHHITLVNAQAGVAHHLMQSHPDKAYQALADIKATSRTALDELRATVGLLRQDDDPPETLQPAPRFEYLEDLLASFRTTGFDVRLTRRGTARPLTGTGDLAAYRIVQEALTNASKHGTVAQAHVELTYNDTSLHLTVTNPAQPGRRGAGTGHGLIGMRERAENAAGTFATTLAANTFVLQAMLPLQEQGQSRQ